MSNRTRAEYLEMGDGPDGRARSDLDDTRDVLGASVTWADPPRDVIAGVLAEVRGGRRSNGEGSPGRWLGVGGVAAAVLLVVALLVFWPSGRPEIVLAGTELSPGASGVAMLDATGGGWEIKLDVDLPPAEVGHYYEGWVWNDTGQGVSIGTFHLRSSDGPITLWAGVDVNEYPSIWVSLQEEGAGPALSDKVLLIGRFDPAGD